MALEPELLRRLEEIHRKLLAQGGAAAPQQQSEPLMLLPWLLREDWRSLSLWRGRSSFPDSEAESSVWRRHEDTLSPLLQLPSLGVNEGPEGPVAGCSGSAVPVKQTSCCYPQPVKGLPISEESCECGGAAGLAEDAGLWRKFQ